MVINRNDNQTLKTWALTETIIKHAETIIKHVGIKTAQKNLRKNLKQNG